MDRADSVSALVDAFPADASERPRLALDAGAIIPAWVWDIPNDCVIADERSTHSIGISTKRCLAGIPIVEAFDSVYPDDVDRLVNEIEKSMVRGRAFRYEYRVRHEIGCYRRVEANGRAEFD